MKIVVICGAGVGTSAILAVNAERVLAKHGIDATVHATNADELLRDAADAQVVLTTAAYADIARESGWADVIVIDNILDRAEIETKLTETLL